jgi:hypothetical protein
VAPLTREFTETVKARAVVDENFRLSLLEEAIELLISGDLETGKVLLRDYINATIGFKQLGVITNKSSKSLMRMLSPDGNPRADNMFSVIASLQKQEGARLSVRAKR